MISTDLLMFAIPITGILFSFLVARSSGDVFSTKKSAETFIAIVIFAYGNSKLISSGSHIIFMISLLVSFYVLSFNGNYTKTKREAELVFSFTLLLFSTISILNAVDRVSSW